MTTKQKAKTIWQPCVSCDRETFHGILHRHVASEYEYRMDIINEMLMCLGCHTVSFRKVVRDYESAYPIDGDEWHVPEEVTSYPKILKGHSSIDDVYDLPISVRDIYTQSVYAIREESNTLAGIGLRATVEAICNEQSIAGRTLEKRIDALAKGGLISQKDAERLHAIRFLGNDAAHDIKRASSRNLLIALRIIEHLLINIYILDNEADGRLDTIIKTFEQFEKVINKKLSDFTVGDEVPLAKIFGKDMRRLHGHVATHEKTLIEKITSGEYVKLSVGKYSNYAGSKEQMQHFIVV